MGQEVDRDDARIGPGIESLAAGEGAIKYAVIEYDNAPGDVFADIQASYDFLTKGGYAA